MITCKLLNRLYGRDTRPTQWLNVAMAVLWSVIALGECTACYAIDLPATVAENIPQIAWLFIATMVFSLASFITDGRVHQITKAFGLALGGLAHIIIANSYMSAYPPLDPMLLVSVVISGWLLGAVFFILQCEGINGGTRYTP